MLKMLVLLLALYALETSAEVSAERAALEAAISQDRRDVSALLELARLCLATGDLAAGETAVANGLKYARDAASKLDLYAIGIRLANAQGDFRAARANFRRARRLAGMDQHAEVQVVMAEAFIREREFDEARALLEAALALQSGFKDEAARILSNLQRVERASLITDSPFAFAPQITRAEVAALISDQFRIATALGELRDGRPVVTGETSDQGLTDYATSPYREAIVSVHRLGVRSLHIRNGAFRPDAPISRVELAMIVEDVLAVTQGASRTHFIGSPSPFSDLSSSSTGFNAVMTAVTRGLMQGSDTGEIHPDELVSGAETILVLDRLNSLLQKTA